MTINEAWENINHRLNEYVELSHSYSPRDNEAERIVEAFIAESPLKAFVITLFNSAGSVNRNRTQDYKNGYIDALCDIMDMFIDQE